MKKTNGEVRESTNTQPNQADTFLDLVSSTVSVFIGNKFETLIR